VEITNNTAFVLGFLKSLKNSNNTDIKICSGESKEDFERGYNRAVISRAEKQNRILDSFIKELEGMEC